MDSLVDTRDRVPEPSDDTPTNGVLASEAASGHDPSTVDPDLAAAEAEFEAAQAKLAAAQAKAELGAAQAKLTAARAKAAARSKSESPAPAAKAPAEPEVAKPDAEKTNGTAPAVAAGATAATAAAATVAAKSKDKVAEPEAVKPAEKVAEPEAVKPAEKVAEPEAVKPAEKVAEPEAVKPAEKVAEPEAVKPAEKVAEPEAVKPAEKVAEPEAVKPAEKVAEPEVVKPATGKAVGTAAAATAATAAVTAGTANKADDAEKPKDKAVAPAESKTAEAAAGTESETKDADVAASETGQPASGDKADAPTTSRSASLLNSTKAKVIAAVALVLVISLGVGGFVWYHNTHVPSDVAFRVFGKNVPISELNDDIQVDKALVGLQVPTDGPDKDKFNRGFAQATAMGMVIQHAAQQQNIVIADRQVYDQLARFVSEKYGPGDDGHSKFVQELANQGTSEQKVFEQFRNEMTLVKLATQIGGDVKVSDQEVQQYFNTHQAQLANPETRDVHNIVVGSKADGDDIVSKVKAGTSFDQLASQESLDTSTKAQGGELGRPVAAQELAQALGPDYAKAAFSAPVTGVYGPVQTGQEWSVGLITAVTPSSPAVLDKIKEPLRQFLVQQQQVDKWLKFLGQQIKDAGVVYNPNYRPANPNALPTPDGGQQSPDALGTGQPGPQAPPN